MTVHFPAFLMNHVAILPPEMWPRGIFVNWYVIGKGGKISKSKGGAQPIPGAAEELRRGRLRLYYAHIASPFADVEWDEEAVEGYTARTEKMERTLLDLMSLDGRESDVDGWLVSRMASRVLRVQGDDETVRPALHGQRGLFRDVQRPALVPEAGRCHAPTMQSASWIFFCR